jgi:cytochrome c5
VNEPKIGDEQAWKKRASQGLSALTDHALKGIRQMPAHGGNPNLSDFEIKRAVTYMVNQSGGKWIEPISKKVPPTARTGEQIVKAQCGRCHETGAGGAPKIGDRAAWAPRLKDGLDSTVRSAIRTRRDAAPRRHGQSHRSEVRSASSTCSTRVPSRPSDPFVIGTRTSTNARPGQRPTSTSRFSYPTRPSGCST